MIDCQFLGLDLIFFFLLASNPMLGMALKPQNGSGHVCDIHIFLIYFFFKLGRRDVIGTKFCVHVRCAPVSMDLESGEEIHVIFHLEL